MVYPDRFSGLQKTVDRDGRRQVTPRVVFILGHQFAFLRIAGDELVGVGKWIGCPHVNEDAVVEKVLTEWQRSKFVHQYQTLKSQT